MLSRNNFFVIYYEENICHPLIKWWSKIKETKTIKYEYTEENIEEFDNLVKDIKKFDFKTMDKLANQIQLLDKQKKWRKHNKLDDEYDDYYNQFIELSNKIIFGKVNTHIVFYSFNDKPTFQNTSEFYKYISSTKIIRDKKTYNIDDKLLLDMFSKNPEFYKESLFIDTDLNPNILMSAYTSMFQKYFNQIYPIVGKNKNLNKETNCNQSKNGILRGLVHMIGYTGINGPRDEYLMNIINSKYLEMMFKENNPDGGVFTTILGKDNSIEQLYHRRPGIYLIFSLSLLDDFDYWCGKHNLGKRNLNMFYKDSCHKCDKKLKNYSAAERCYMEMYSKEFIDFYELMLASDVNIKRYLEAIYINNNGYYNTIKKSKVVPSWVKKLVVQEEDRNKIYRKHCKGETPKKINDRTFNSLVKKIEKREPIEEIPSVNYEAIINKRKVEFLYDPMTINKSNIFPKK